MAIVVLVYLELESKSQRDKAVEVLKAHQKRCLANEPGTLQFEILRPHNTDTKLTIIEKYASAEALQEHRDGESAKQSWSEGKAAGIVFKDHIVQQNTVVS